MKIEVPPTAFRTETLTLTLTLTSNLDIQSDESYGHGQGQRYLGSKLRVETDGRTDGCECITSRANEVGN